MFPITDKSLKPVDMFLTNTFIPMEKFQKVQDEIARRAKRKPRMERSHPAAEEDD